MPCLQCKGHKFQPWSGNQIPNCCCCSVAKSCLTLCNPMSCSTPGFSVLHYLPEFVQTHVHWVNDAIKTSHPLLPTSSPALNLSQHQGLFPLSWLFLLGGQSIGASPLVAQMVKNLPVRQETWVQSLGWEDPLQKGMATHFSILAWRIPWKEEPGGLQSLRLQRSHILQLKYPACHNKDWRSLMLPLSPEAAK